MRAGHVGRGGQRRVLLVALARRAAGNTNMLYRVLRNWFTKPKRGDSLPKQLLLKTIFQCYSPSIIMDLSIKCRRTRGVFN